VAYDRSKYDHRSFRQKLNKDARAQKKGRSRGRGRGSYFKLPPSPTTGRLIPGEYPGPDGDVRPYFIKRTHYDVLENRVRDCQGRECIPCWQRENGIDGKGKGSKTRFNSASSKYVYTWAHAAYYHLVDERNAETGKEYKIKEVCEGKRRCEHCKKDVERVFGKKMHWTFNEDDHAVLESFDRELFAKCQCTLGDIFVKAYECAKCETTMLESDRTNLTQEEIVQFGDEEQRCDRCGEEDFPQYVLECIEETKDGEWIKCCEDPRPANLFCVNVDVKGVTRERRDGKEFTALQISGHVLEDIDERMKDIEPYDFDAMFDQSLEQQAKWLSVDIPEDLRTQAGGKRAVDYSG
jgi:hypothetical protein